jgi:hypothetical protein
MDFSTFKKAVESVRGYQGIVGIMGGEPTLHPLFDKFVKYYAYVVPRVLATAESLFGPISNMQAYVVEKWGCSEGKHRGLFTSLGPGFAKHFELIREFFDYLCVNMHQNQGRHQALMLPRKELGIGDIEFFKLRDSCWIQNLWSSSITPKGAFFCEIAAAFDMLTDGPGGWPIEKGWWRRKPEDFGDQLNWCEMCSACLMVPSIPDMMETDIVSPEWKKRLDALGSKKKVIVFDVSNFDKSKYAVNLDIQPYLYGDKDFNDGSGCNPNLKRVVEKDVSYLMVSEINMVLVCVNYSDKLKATLKYNKNRTDSITIVTEKEDKNTIEVAKEYGAYVVLSEKKKLNEAVFNKGAMLNDGIRSVIERTGVSWILLTDADILLPPDFKKISKLVLNPGVLYYAERVDVNEGQIDNVAYNQEFFDNAKSEGWGNKDSWGYFQLFNVKASALNEKKDNWYPEEFYSAGSVDHVFMDQWAYKKWCLTRCAHLYHGGYSTNWYGAPCINFDVPFRERKIEVF